MVEEYRAGEGVANAKMCCVRFVIPQDGETYNFLEGVVFDSSEAEGKQ